jgi:hypothetical protein
LNRPPSTSNHFATGLLAAGALIGALLAATGLLDWQDDKPGDNVVARINDLSIRKGDYLGYLDLVSRDKRNPMTEQDRRHVLDRIIEEKLLIERGLALDLPHSDPKVRKTIVNAMIETIVSDASSAEPDDAELEEFYLDNQNYFALPARVQLRRMVFRGDQARSRASEARQKLQAMEWNQVESEYADRDILSLPGSPLPLSKLRGYLGPSLTESALALEPGQYSEPLADQAGYTIVWLQDVQKSEPQPLQAIREQVAREFQRRASDAALRSYLDQLRREAEVVVDEAFLSELTRLDSSE